jgi:hypothetical protein
MPQLLQPATPLSSPSLCREGDIQGRWLMLCMGVPHKILPAVWDSTGIPRVHPRVSRPSQKEGGPLCGRLLLTSCVSEGSAQEWGLFSSEMIHRNLRSRAVTAVDSWDQAWLKGESRNPEAGGDRVTCSHPVPQSHPLVRGSASCLLTPTFPFSSPLWNSKFYT